MALTHRFAACFVFRTTKDAGGCIKRETATGACEPDVGGMLARETSRANIGFVMMPVTWLFMRGHLPVE
jgi:hypothetical protein